MNSSYPEDALQSGWSVKLNFLIEDEPMIEFSQNQRISMASIGMQHQEPCTTVPVWHHVLFDPYISTAHSVYMSKWAIYAEH